jgi:hypothetical protein
MAEADAHPRGCERCRPDDHFAEGCRAPLYAEQLAGVVDELSDQHMLAGRRAAGFGDLERAEA